MVGAAPIRISCTFYFHNLFDLGRISGSALLARSKRRRLPFAVLFTRDFRQLATRNFRREAWLVALVAFVLTRSSGSMGSRRLPPYMLLLAWRVLQSVLGRSSCVHCRRTTKRISGRNLVPADHAEHSPLFPLYRVAVHPRSGARRVEGDVVR